ncbi:MAG: DUF3990 domain-containing protein [Parasporobacterium sp.]|nr:DUF3990 domain-containing protein [Parasporobacterium sp.]
MSQFNIRKILYHGTVSQIDKIDVSKGRGRKDFGKGFYIAVTKKQAIGMMHKKYREALHRSRNKKNFDIKEHLYEIILDEEYAKKLNIRVFETADLEWLDFILKCREDGGTPHNYDIVIGPTADDDTMLCLRTYWDGVYGEPNTGKAKQILLDNLEPDNLGVQYFVGEQTIADKLIVEFREIEWRE